MGASIWADIALIALLILIGGVFVAAEMALVTLRESQVKTLAGKGARGRKVAALAANPNRFLSAVQICITFTGFLSASLGAATLSGELSPVLERTGMGPSAAGIVALVIVTLVISFFSIVFGELVAKRLGMQRSESIALALAGFIDLVARLTKPLIWFLGAVTNVVVRLLGGDPATAREEVSEAELRQMVTTAPSLTKEEREIVDEVFAAGGRSLREVMVPRTETEFLNGDESVQAARLALESATHSRFPVTGRSVDDIIGFLHIRDLMYRTDGDQTTPIRRLVRPVVFLPDTVKVLHALTSMRREGAHLAIVRDEYGGTAGIVTLEDLVEELIGDIQDEYDEAAPRVIAEAGRLEVEGLTTLEQFEDLTGLALPEGPYDTVAGFWVAMRGQLPKAGDSVTVVVASGQAPEPVRLEMTVTEMDARRAARISVRRLPA